MRTAIHLALEQGYGELSDLERGILRELSEEADRELSGGQLAQLLGLSHHGPVNLAMARMAKRLAANAGVEPPKRRDGTPRWWNLVATGRWSDDGAKYLWKLRPQLCEVVQELEGVKAVVDSWQEKGQEEPAIRRAFEPGLNAEDFGTTDDYLSAFEAVLAEGIPGNYIALLRAHFAAPRHTATWAQLAKEVGYSNGSAVNLHYGKLAKRIARHLGVHTRPKGFWLYVLADWAHERDPSSGHTAFVLRCPAIRALTLLGVLSGVRKSSPTTPLPPDLEVSALEGDPRMYSHLERERKVSLVKAKRAQARNSAGHLECEACRFVTRRSYPELVTDICEVHHRRPLGELEEAEEIDLQDLAILCPNCHRAIHRTRPMMSVEEFRDRLSGSDR